MQIHVARIIVDGLTCQDCDCGSCASAAVAAIKQLEGVVYVGVDRRHPAFIVRYQDSTVGPEAMRSAVIAAGLTLDPGR